jgi:hypothetical protein
MGNKILHHNIISNDNSRCTTWAGVAKGVEEYYALGRGTSVEALGVEHCLEANYGQSLPAARTAALARNNWD